MKINVHVKPSAGKSELTLFDETHYYVTLKAPAQENKANMELIKFLSKELKARVKLVSGLKSKNKVLEIEKYSKKS